MSLSVILDVAIGLIGLYLALSVIASALLEFYAALLSRPGRILRWGIAQLFNDPLKVGLSKAFYEHPLLRGMTGGKLPSQIDPKLAARVLVDIMDQNGVLNGVTPVPVLAPFIREFGTDKAKLLQPIADWFNEGVNRLSGIAARRSQVLLLAIGAVAAVVFNIDSVEITRALATQEPLRTAAVEAAKHELERNAELGAPPKDKDTGAQGTDAQGAATQGTTTPATGDQPDATQADKAKADAADKKVNDDVADLIKEYSTLPIGWPDSQCRALKAAYEKDGKTVARVADCAVKGKPEASMRTAIAAHWLGWAITALAVSLGAQFWYRLLGQLIKLRGPDPEDKKTVPAAATT